jgi:ribonucleoside-diphosphate reductase alpha chain
MPLASQPLSADVLRDKYAQPGEHGVDDVRRRIAVALAQAEPPAQRASLADAFLQAQRDGVLLAGRVAANAGIALHSTMMSCFVQPVGDSIHHGPPGEPPIYAALAEAAETLRLGGGVGYDFSLIRPRGALVAGTGAEAAGPLAVIRLFDASSRLFEFDRGRRAAQMAVLRCDHPDVQAFAAAKAEPGLERFNLSVAVTDDFMRALATGGEVELVHAAAPGPHQRSLGRRADGLHVYARVKAADIWASIVRSAHAVGEPGLLFLDRIRAEDNLGWCEAITATNPCGEEPLPPYGACCLAALDLTRLVVDPFAPSARIDEDALRRLVPQAVRMLDDVLEVTQWPLPSQRSESLSTRRIGLGVTGLADALIMLGLRYDSEAARAAAARVAAVLCESAYHASCDLALERGAYPRFSAEGVLRAGSFGARLSAELRSRIRRDGMRNSHLLAFAPAGSISLAFADNVSNGIEPPYEWCYLRNRRQRDGRVEAYEVEDHAWRLYRHLKGPAALTPAFVTALELSPQAHLAMVRAVAPFVDGSISKTVNAVPALGREAFDALYRQAWDAGLKGITAFRANSPHGAVLWRRAPAEPVPQD